MWEAFMELLEFFASLIIVLLLLTGCIGIIMIFLPILGVLCAMYLIIFVVLELRKASST